MAIVTDLQFYLDNGLKDMCDLCVKRVDAKWDNLIIIDGKERAGKSTLGKSIAYYISQEMKMELKLENCFFDPEEMYKYVINNEKKLIIWDEAAFGALSINWQSKMQQLLIKTLMVCGKYRHTLIFIIPSFFYLSKYMALHRSLGLIHVYSPDLIKRGHFSCYNDSQKTWIYNSFRKSETYGKVLSFRGKFTLKNTDKIWDDVAYEEKKTSAIQKLLEISDNKAQINKLKILQHNIATYLDTSEAARACKVTERTISRWKKHSVELLDLDRDISTVLRDKQGGL